MMRAISLPLIAVLCLHLQAQTSQATLTGAVRDAQDQPVANARVLVTHEDTGRQISAVSNAQGQYILQFLPVGRYIVRVQAAGFRPLVRADIELHVAQRETADFQLQPLPPGIDASAFAAGGQGLIYGADAQAKIGVVDDRPPAMTDATSSTVSGVIDANRIQQLPLNGRDVYTLFVVMPGVTSDNATQRGLGFSVNGFPVSSSNYLLDGLDNNNVQNTFPVTLLSPDAIDEYRLATNNFSAEYGRGAFVANVVTSTGGNRWHGQLFEFLINEKLSAGAFQDNAAGLPKPEYKEHTFGYAAGGPLRRDRAFLFTSIEALEFRTAADPTTVILPSPAFIASAAGPIARSLFQRFPERPLSQVTLLGGDHISGTLTSPTPIANIAASARADFELRPDRDSLFVRFASIDQSAVTLTSPYQGLDAPFVISARNLGLGYIHRFASSRVNELKTGWSHSLDQFVPPVAGLAGLIDNQYNTALPGNVNAGADQSYRDDLLHVVDNFSLLVARHHLVIGGDYQSVWSHSLLAPEGIGVFSFANLAAFGADQPSTLDATVNRFDSTTPQVPDYTRGSRHDEFGLFIQDNWRVTPRLTLNLGLRYESFGTPAADLNFVPGSGGAPAAQVISGTLTPAMIPFHRDGNNFAPRFGAAFDLFGNSRTILRAGLGVYFDRPFGLIFDALRQNTLVEETFSNNQTPFRYASPAGLALPARAPAAPPGAAYFVDPNLRTPYVQTWFAGVQQSLGRNTVIEVNQTGSLARKLAVDDIWNRELLNPAVRYIYATTNQGDSDFLSLQSSVLRRFSRGFQFQAAWTWSHAIDNQGDPLVSNVIAVRGFQQEFDAQGDRGNADFDQRHNLVFNWIWRTPRASGALGHWTGGWQLAGLAGYRSGFPLTVFTNYFGSTPSGQVLVLPRANYLGPSPGAARPAAGGMTLLDSAAFAVPASGLGNTTRGEFRGPGFWNYDASISREFAVRALGENSRLQLRTEFFNLFNHTNLGNPDTNLSDGSFGIAQFGRTGASSVAAGTAPLTDAPRRIQVVIRISF